MIIKKSIKRMRIINMILVSSLQHSNFLNKLLYKQKGNIVQTSYLICQYSIKICSKIVQYVNGFTPCSKNNIGPIQFELARTWSILADFV